MYDQHGEPLFADLKDEIYLSHKYAASDVEQLKLLGTSKITLMEALDRVEADLMGPNSKLKAITTDDDWHTRTSKLLSLPWVNDKLPLSLERIKSLSLIPLYDNKWVSTKSLPIYLPHTGSIPVPTDLGLNIVQPTAVSNASRKRLLLHLGVTQCVPRSITSLIVRRYSRGEQITLEASVSHLRYLYWNLPEDVPVLDNHIWLIDQQLDPVYRSGRLKEYIYFEDPEEEYGVQQLLQIIDEDTPGLFVHLLNAAYLQAVPDETRRHDRSWESWLEEAAGVRRVPQLLNVAGSALSDELDYIIECRPEKLVGLLKHHWLLYEPLIAKVLKEIRTSMVPSEGGSMVTLGDSYLPLPKLKTIIEELQVTNFPFILVPRQLSDQDRDDWRFLKQLGVGLDDNLDFYIECLERIAGSNPIECSPDAVQALIRVYGGIQKNCFTPEDSNRIQRHFTQNNRIYIPTRIQHDAKWVSSVACVWAAPEWLEVKQGLDGIGIYGELRHFFQVILKIRDSNWRDFLKELQRMKEQSHGNANKVSDIYRRLWRDFEHDTNWEVLRTSFEESELVFVPSQNAWKPLSTCVWADNRVRIPRRASIGALYASLEDFFVRILGVPKPNLEMHVQALKELARGQPQVTQIKDMMMLISSMDPSADDLLDLRNSNIFPVRFPNGQRKLANKYADFAIVDRSEYGTAFEGKVIVLDLSLEQVRTCRPFLLASDLERKHISALVEEKTMVEGGIKTSDLSDNLRVRAYAFFRCAVHYNSSKTRDGDRSLYDLLRHAAIYISNGISKSMTLVQYSESVTVENSKANFHLDESGDQLRLYVPADTCDREVCFLRQLPRRLLSFLAIFDPTAEAVISGVLRSSSLVVVDEILKDAGIVEVDGINRPLESEVEQPQRRDESGRESTETQPSQSSRMTAALTESTLYPTAGTADPYTELPSTTSSRLDPRPISTISSLSRSSHSSRTTPSIDPPLEDTGYAALLDRVINAASRATLPECGTYAMNSLRNSPPSGAYPFAVFDTVFGNRSMERDKKVGAAGELYVFELLLNLKLSGFSRANWQSTIRKEVRVHDKYRDLEPWNGFETADITYRDSKGELTEFLIGKGYLPYETWINERPMYYLEVKTTTRDCGEQFYMSGSQYQRMQRMRLEPGRAVQEIYILLRVFNLEQNNIDLRVYLDPETSRVNGELAFTVDTWAVRPCSSTRNT